MFRFVGVGTDRDDLAAKFPVTPDDLLSWIGVAKTVLAAAGVQLEPFSEGDKFSYNLINHILIFSPVIIFIGGRTVADNIVEVSVYVEILIALNIFKNGFKIFPVGILFLTSFIIGCVVWIKSMHNMGGTYDKIKWILR